MDHDSLLVFNHVLKELDKLLLEAQLRGSFHQERLVGSVQLDPHVLHAIVGTVLLDIFRAFSLRLNRHNIRDTENLLERSRGLDGRTVPEC